MNQQDRYCLFPRTPGLFSSLNVQKDMLRDSVRMRTFKQAILNLVQPGDVVVDLGTGTGVLAIWAALAGARKVYAIEETDTAEVAQAVIAANGLSDVITVLHANSMEVSLPERANVLLAELVGHFLLEEGILESIADVREKFLTHDAKVLPARAEMFLAPVQLDDEFEEISFWSNFKDPDLSAVRAQAANSAYVEAVRPGNVLADPTTAFALDFSKDLPGPLEIEFEVFLKQSGRLDGIAGWFQIWLAENVCLSTAPWDPPTHWKQCVFPLEKPYDIGSGERVRCKFSIEPFAPGSRWRWEIHSGSPPAHSETHEFAITYGIGSRLLKERF